MLGIWQYIGLELTTVVKGNFEPLPDQYGEQLQKIVRMMLKVKASKRPSAESMLNHPIIKNKIEKLGLQGNLSILFLIANLHIKIRYTEI